MTKVIIIGGGWAGCAAALTAKKAGADVTLIERTDLLVGLGNVGGIMRNNGRFTATEENILLGASDLFEITDKIARHKNIEFPGHKHANLYDVTKVEPEVRSLLKEKGINILFETRAIDVIMKDNSIEGIVLADDSIIYGDIFIDTTGTTGPMGNCVKYGNGCSMCILRCPSYGPRISISRCAGAKDFIGTKKDGTYGAFSGSCKLNKDSLDQKVLNKLNKDGVVILKIPDKDVNLDKLGSKVCQQYSLDEFAKNVILLDTGHVKLMAPYYPIDKLRKIEGLENARYEDPYSGGKSNSVRYLSVAPRDNSMRVLGINNLLCGGEKSGLFVGHTEAITTGSLAGHNSARLSLGLPLMTLPRSLAVGEIIAYANESIDEEDGLSKRFTFAGSEFFERMKEKELYTININEIKSKIERMNLLNIYNERLV